MNQEDRNDLQRDASEFAYQYIKLSGLFHSLPNEQWEQLAQLIGKRLMELTDGMIDVAATIIETNGPRPVSMTALGATISRYERAA